MNRLQSWIRAVGICGREFFRWRDICLDSPRIYYGLDTVTGPDGLVSGGLVKLQDLVPLFPNHNIKPNILYLVSSSLPPYADLIARLASRAGAKIVINQNGVGYPAWCPDDWQQYNRPMQLLLQIADHVFYQSEFCRRAADSFVGPTGGTKEILYNPIDTRVFVPGGKHPESVTRLLVAGTHGSWYRIKIALDVLRELHQRGEKFKLILAGRCTWRVSEEDAVVEAREYASNIGVTPWIEYVGPYKQQDAVALFQRADVLLHTQYNDACPRLVLESMACGIPIVYSASGGVPELTGQLSGIGIPAPEDWSHVHLPDAVAMATAVLDVIASWDAYSQNARKRAVEMFDVTSWRSRHAELFKSFC